MPQPADPPTAGPDALIAELCEVGRDAARRGLVLASAGNLSARLPDRDGFVVTGAGSWFDCLEPADFSVLAMDGTVLGEGDWGGAAMYLALLRVVLRPGSGGDVPPRPLPAEPVGARL